MPIIYATVQTSVVLCLCGDYFKRLGFYLIYLLNDIHLGIIYIGDDNFMFFRSCPFLPCADDCSNP